MRKPAILHYGDTLPPATEFEDGDLFYLRPAGELYIRTGGAWALSASSSMITSVQNDGTGVELVSDTGTSNTAKVRSINTAGNGITLAITASGQEVELNFDKVAAGWGSPDGFATLDSSTKVVERLSYEGVANGVATLDSNSMLNELPEFDTLATLRAASGIGAKRVFVRGYSSDGDGGEGIFYHDASDLTSPDNDGTVIVDADGKRWKREVENTIQAAWFGAFSDGVDRTSEFANAVSAASAGGYALEVAPGTLKLSNSTTLELGGVSKITGNATIDVSAATASPVFRVSGTRTLIASGIVLAEGQTSLTVGAGLPIQRGDTIVVTSVEASPNPARTYYYKGSRVFAETYDNTTGSLTVYPGVDFSYTSAYVWLIKERHLVIDGGISIVGAEGGSQLGVEAKYARVDMHGTLKHFGVTGIRYVTSSGTITGSILDTVYSGTGTSYGVSVSDLSDVHISGATIIAARHAVAAGGGVWDAGDSGGTAGTGAAYPSSYTINGGHYASNGSLASNYAIDAHGIARSVIINGAIVDGGMSVAARESVITNNVITFSASSLGGLYVGGDTVSTSWGRLTFSNNTIRGLGSTPAKAAIRIGGTMNTATITNNTVVTDYGGDTADVGSAPLRIDGVVSNIVVRGNDITTTNTPKTSYIAVSGELDFANNRMNGVYMTIAATANDTRMRILGNSAASSPAYGIFVRGDGYTGHDLVVAYNTAYDNAGSGIYVYTFDRAVVVGNRCFNNGSNTALAGSTRAGITLIVVGTAHVVGNNCSSSGANQTYGIAVNGSTVTTTLFLIGNETTGNASADYYTASASIKARNGNRGTAIINDYVLATDGNLYQFDGTSWSLA